MVLFSSIFRFRDEKGSIFFGEAGESSNHTLESLTGRSVPIFRGEHPWDDNFVLTEEQRNVAEVWIYGWAPGLMTEASTGSLSTTAHANIHVHRPQLQAACR
jgi:hypothetical protein